jgi:hypothetical protein
MDVQAAEQILRIERGISGVDAVEVTDVRRDRAMTTAVFAIGSDRFEVTIERAEAPPKLLTCHSDRPRTAPEYRTVAIRASP